MYSCFTCRYVDVILQLIDKAGDFVSDDIWFRVVQFVTNNEDLQVTIVVLPLVQFGLSFFLGGVQSALRLIFKLLSAALCGFESQRIS